MKKITAVISALAMLAALFIFPVSADDELNIQGAVIENLGTPVDKLIPANSNHAYGRSVWDIAAYNGKIYIGSGDYNTNSGNAFGRSNIWAYSTADKKWRVEKYVAEEAVNRFRLIDGDLCFVGMDAMHNGEFENYFRFYKDKGKWEQKNVLPDRVMHNFDLLESSDGTVFAGLGTDDGDCNSAAVSYDGGETFVNVSFRRDGHILVDSDVTNNGALSKEIYCRTYNIFEYNENIYATWFCNCETSAGRELCDALRNQYAGIYVWNKEDKIFDFHCASPALSLVSDSFATGFKTEFNGKFMFIKGAAYVFSEDLTSVSYPLSKFGNITCARTVGDELYFSTASIDYDTYKCVNKFYSTYDMEHFTELCSFEYTSPVCSFCISGGQIYAGTGGVNSKEFLKTSGTVFRIEAGKFSDVKLGYWYNGAIDYAIDNNLFNGTSPTTFAPNVAMTRGMVVQVLYNLEGKPTLENKNIKFTDVKEKDWFADAVIWAAANGVVNGKSPTSFAPNDVVTREQLSTILRRYADLKGYDVNASSDLTKFPDGNKVSSYAVDSLKWAVGAGLISGNKIGGVDMLDARGSATRAQVAKILRGFCENVVN